MSTQPDPYYDIRDKIEASVTKIGATFEGLKKTFESGAYTPALSSGFKSIDFDLKVVKKEAKSLRKVVLTIEEKREVFSHISDAELITRKKFINSAGSRIKTIEKYVETALAQLSQHNASTTSTTSSSTTPSNTKLSSAKGGSSRLALTSGQSKPEPSSARQALRNRQAKQSTYDTETNEVLEDMSVILDRLAGTSTVMKDQLVRQSDLISEAQNEMVHTESMMEMNLNKMDALLKKGKCGKLSLLLILVLIAFGMLFLIIYV